MTVSRLFPTAAPEHLAVLRILVGGFAVAYLLLSAPRFLTLADADRRRFEPVGVLTPLSGPVPASALLGAFVVAGVAGVGFVAGLWFRCTGPLFAALLLLLCTYRSSWGQILWLENLMVLHVAIVGCSRAADARRWRLRHRSVCESPPPSETYGIPVRVAALVTVATYWVAAVAKFRIGGTEWMTSDSLRNHVAATAARSELLDLPASPIGQWLVGYGWLFSPMAVGSVLLELAAPLALLGGRLRNGWVALTWLMHVAIALLMFVVFPYPLFGLAFAPFFDLERLAEAWDRRSLRRRVEAPSSPPESKESLMSISLSAVTFDCTDALRQAQFWSGVFGRQVDSARPPSEYFASIGLDDPSASPHRFMFIKVPEGKTVKNRVHLDFDSPEPDVEVERILALGATKVHDKQEYGMRWTTLADPEGNEFCIGTPH